MSSFEQHCKECEKKLGKRFEEVHKFLDQFASTLGYDHRKIFHHKYGVILIRHFFGDKAAEAAELHIKADCDGKVPDVEDWMNSIDFLRGLKMENIQTEVWLIEEKQEIADWEGWTTYLVCDKEETADNVLEVYKNKKIVFRKTKVSVAIGVTKGGSPIYSTKL